MVGIESRPDIERRLRNENYTIRIWKAGQWAGNLPAVEKAKKLIPPLTFAWIPN
jgi:hypothetical protein